MPLAALIPGRDRCGAEIFIFDKGREVMKAIRKFIIGSALAATAVAAAPTLAQQITGTLGSPGATTTISGKQLPPPDPEVRRRDQG